MTEPIRCPGAARFLLASSVLVLAALVASPARAQASGDAVIGKLLFDDTPNVVGNQQLGACWNCHSTVENRRIQLSGNQFGPLSFATALSRLQSAIGSNVGGAMGQFSVLSTDQVRDLAAYLADLPTTSDTQLDFAPSAINMAQSLSVDLTNAKAPSTTLGNTVRVATVAISGANASDFTITSDACVLQTLSANGTCRVTVRFMSATTAAKNATLTFTLDPAGSVTNFTRTVALTGAVAVAAPPPASSPSGGGGDGGGGGALGVGWLAALAAAVIATRRATRRTR